MSVKISSVLLLFLTVMLVIPLSFSGVGATAQSLNDNKNSSSTYQNGTTNTKTEINPANSTEAKNIGLQVSNFVHNATILFQQQRNETIQAIKECHQNIQNATSENRTKVKDECDATLNTIKEKYQDVRKQFQDLFKQFRESVIVLRHDAEGLRISEQKKEMVMKNIDEDAARHGLNGINIALGHVKGMGEKGKMGIESALNHVNGTQNEIGSRNMTNNNSPPLQSPNQDLRGPPNHPGNSGLHGKP